MNSLNARQKIGVFDSGKGGKSVALALETAFPEHDIVFIADEKNMPYGSRSEDELQRLVLPKLRQLEAAGCAVVVIACNTVSTTVLPQLQKQISTPLIGVEPMVKQAASATKSQKIIVCATPTTLNSQRYKQLKTQISDSILIFAPGCGDWAFLIESNQINRNKIAKLIEPILKQGADVVVLGCTHYHWIEHEIKEICGKNILILQPESLIIKQLRLMLKQLP